MEQGLGSVNRSLSEHLFRIGTRKAVPAGAELLREGQFVQVVPMVLQGLIKVYTRRDDRELLLYYIEPDQSCIMSFSAVLREAPSRVYAQAEADSELLLLDAKAVRNSLGEHPDMNRLFFELFTERYGELLDTIHHILFNQLDVRLGDHLRRKAALLGTDALSISHQQLADELGTVREVISRTIKKLEAGGQVIQEGQRIRILKM